MPRRIMILLILSWLLLTAQSTVSVDAIQITDPQVDYQFGEKAVFTAQLHAPDPGNIQEIDFFYQSQGKSIQVNKIAIPTDGNLSFELDLHDGALRPFAAVTYWFQVQPANGQPYKSSQFSFTYEDNRFTWQTMQEGLFIVHWIEGDLVFGQAVYNSAVAGLASIENLLQLPPLANPLDIYVYAHAKDLQSALELGGQEWIAGHASPDLGVVLVTIAPGPEQRLQMEKQVPHELTHILVYQKTKKGYDRQPVWLMEGLASLAEVYRNSDYSLALDTAKKNQALLPIASLCAAFPKDASNAFLAYAEADSFTHFLLNNYGTKGLMQLVDQYSDGLGCAEGFAASFGTPLSRAEYRWRQESLGIDVGLMAVVRLLPYLFILAILLVFPSLPGLFGRPKPAANSITSR